MMPIESWRDTFNENYPIYQQIIQRFSQSIVKGEIRPGSRIPSIRDLAVMLKVNANTIQRAYQEMDRAGLIVSQRGMGYFLMDNQEIVGTVKNSMVREAIASFLEGMRALGFDDTQILTELKNQMEKGVEKNESVDC